MWLGLEVQWLFVRSVFALASTSQTALLSVNVFYVATNRFGTHLTTLILDVGTLNSMVAPDLVIQLMLPNKFPMKAISDNLISKNEVFFRQPRDERGGVRNGTRIMK